MLSKHRVDSLSIRNVRVIDPYENRDETADIHISQGRITPTATNGGTTIDGTRLVACPGLMDVHVHLREPGQSHKETIATGTAAAAAGGFTHVACMPNTSPPLDQPEPIRWIIQEADSHGYCSVMPLGTISVGRRGEKVADLPRLKDAGAVAFSDDGDGVENDDVMRQAMITARELGMILVQHCEYHAISNGGVMHAGRVADEIGLPGLDPRSEEDMIERDIELSRQTGARYHVAHISTARAVEMVREAKAAGLPVTAEVCTHHLLLTDEACRGKDPNFKMHPPLRPAYDVQACLDGLLDGTIDCIVTDHAPHAAKEKAKGFLEAPPGIVGLETAFSLSLEALSAPNATSDAAGLGSIANTTAGLDAIAIAVRLLTAGPTSVFGHAGRPILPDRMADLTLIDPQARWTVDPFSFESKGRNTPFAGRPLVGRPVLTVRGRSVCEKSHPGATPLMPA